MLARPPYRAIAGGADRRANVPTVKQNSSELRNSSQLITTRRAHGGLGETASRSAEKSGEYVDKGSELYAKASIVMLLFRSQQKLCYLSAITGIYLQMQELDDNTLLR